MNENSMNLLIVLGVVVVIFNLIYFLDRRTKTNGTLFPANPGKGLRTLAIVLAVLFLLISGYIYFSFGDLYPYLVLAAIALFVYGMLPGKNPSEPPGKAQAETPSSMLEPMNEPVIGTLERRHGNSGHIRLFLKTYALILLASLIVIAVSFWVSSHPNDPLAHAVLIGGIVLGFLLVVLTHILEIIKLLKMK